MRFMAEQMKKSVEGLSQKIENNNQQLHKTLSKKITLSEYT